MYLFYAALEFLSSSVECWKVETRGVAHLTPEVEL